MATVIDDYPPDQASLSSLVSGIVGDAQTLIRQQVALAREEIRGELRKLKDATIAIAVGVGIAALAALPLVFMLVYLLHELAGWSLWASFGTVGAVLAVVGGGLIVQGIQRFRTLSPLPDQSVAALQENLQWIKHPK